MTFHDRALKEFTRARRSCSARRARVSTRAPDLEPLPARHRALDPLDGPDVLGRPEEDACGDPGSPGWVDNGKIENSVEGISKQSKNFDAGRLEQYMKTPSNSEEKKNETENGKVGSRHMINQPTVSENRFNKHQNTKY